MPTKVAYAATPTLTIGGTLARAAMGNVIALSIDEDILGMTSLEARFSNIGTKPGSTYLYLDRQLFDFGTEIKVGMGPTGSQTELFAGKISALQADYPGAIATLSICAEDRLQDFRLTRRTRTFEDSTTSDIADALASDHGLQAELDLDGPERRVVNQLNLSDLAFLRQLAEADGGEVWLAGDTLHVQRRVARETGTVTLKYPGALLHISIRADLANQCSSITVTGWSVADKDAITESGDAALLTSELAATEASGADLLAAALTTRHERLVVTEPIDSDDAKARAEAAYLARARRFVTGQGTATGSPGVRVGARVTLDGLGKPFNGEYRVTRTRHRFDLMHGYRTDFDVERAGIGAP